MNNRINFKFFCLIMLVSLSMNIKLDAYGISDKANTIKNDVNPEKTVTSLDSSKYKIESSEKNDVRMNDLSQESIPFKEREIENSKSNRLEEETDLNETHEDKRNISDKEGFLFKEARASNSVTPFIFENGSEKSFDNGTDFTIVDDQGRYISGPKLQKADHVIVLKYMGTDILKDTTRWVYSPSYDDWILDKFNSISYNPLTDTASLSADRNVKYKIENWGTYNEKNLNLCVQGYTPKELGSLSYPIIKNFKKFPWLLANNGLLQNRFKIWIEFEDGTRVQDAVLLLPIRTKYTYDSSLFKETYFETGTLKWLSVLNSSIPEGRKALYDANGLPNSLGVKQDNDTNLIMNLLFDAKDDFIISSNLYNVKNGDPVYREQTGELGSNVELFNSEVPVLFPFSYPMPAVYKEISPSNSMVTGNFKITQDLIEQNKNNYPGENDPLVIRLKISDRAGVKTPLKNVKVITTEGIDVTNLMHIQDQENGAIEFSIWGDKLETITGEGTTLTITGEFQPDTKSKQFLDSLNPEDKYFHIPIEASNSDKGFENIDSNEALIEMPKPAATPIPQTVAINTSTKDLKPEELVKDLSSIFPGDSVDVVGFKAEKIFDSVGVNEVIVVIKSVQTGIINEITVPVDVVANLKFKSVPETMAFLPITINSGSKLIERENSDWKIEIDNSIGAEWRVYAKATPVKNTTDQIYTNALLFKDESGVNHQLTSEQTLIAEGNNSDKEPIIKWNKNQGILFNFDPGVMKEGKYEFVIEWNLEMAP